MSQILMPRLSDTMEEGVVSSWHKKPGDPVAAGDALVDIETDKALMEYEAYEDGVLGEILVAEGESAQIGTPIAILVTEADATQPNGDGAAPATANGDGAAAASPDTATPAGTAEAPAGANTAPATAGVVTPAAPAGVPAVTNGDGAGAGTPAPGSATAPGAGSGSAPGSGSATGAGAGSARGGAGSRPPSSPLARRIARENGVDLSTLTGSGPGGRIVRADVEAASRDGVTAASPPPATASVTAPASTAPASTAPASTAPPGTTPAVITPGTGSPGGGSLGSAAAGSAAAAGAVPPLAAEAAEADSERVPLSRIRKVTARRLAESMRTAPHFYLTRVVDVEELLAFRATLNAALAPAKVSVNDLIVKACATALRANPVLNVSFTEEYLLVHKRVNVGVAVALDEGLVVPVIRDADAKSVSAIGAETRELAGRAREKRLTPQEMSGGTFTVSNLGMFGVDAFTAVINPPEAAILAVGATRQDVVFRDGEVVPRNRMTLTLSVDHRACDGATGAAFLGQITDLLESPLRIVA